MAAIVAAIIDSPVNLLGLLKKSADKNRCPFLEPAGKVGVLLCWEWYKS